MNTLTRSFVSLSFAALFAAIATPAQAERVAIVVPDYTVFLDPPTGFVFVKLPAGWKFVGKVEAKDLIQLPVGVVTALLTGEYDDNETSRLASRRAD